MSTFTPKNKKEIKTMGKKQYKIASLFSGCGGLDIGFHDLGFEIVESEGWSIIKQARR